MHIVPRPDSTTDHPPESLTDACPECVVNVELPAWLLQLSRAVRCGYTCTDCRHHWTTDWSR